MPASHNGSMGNPVDETGAVFDAAQDNAGALGSSEMQPLNSESDIEFVIDIFIQAVKDGNLKVVKEMVESGAIDINNDCIDEIPGLHWALSLIHI